MIQESVLEQLHREISKNNVILSREFQNISYALENMQQELIGDTDSMYNDSDDITSVDNVLISIMDSMRNLLIKSQEMLENVEELISKDNDCLDKQSLQETTLDPMHAFCDAVEIVYEKVSSHLVDNGIQIINPKEGDHFSPQEHRAVERVYGDNPGIIHKLVHFGYQKHGEIIRFADVAVVFS